MITDFNHVFGCFWVRVSSCFGWFTYFIAITFTPASNPSSLASPASSRSFFHWCWMPGMQDSGKYPLADAPAYMTELQNQVKDMDPPDFSKQGEHIGKTRGRKPAKATPKAKCREPRAKATPKAKARANRAPKSKAKKATRPSRSRTAKQSVRAKAAAKRAAKPAPKPKAASKARGSSGSTGSSVAVPAAPCPAPDVVDPKPTCKKPRTRKTLPDDNKDRIPPSHVTHNHIYSSAYRKSLSQCPDDKALARKQAAAAVEYFKTHGAVNWLCGSFRSTPRNSTKSADGGV